MKILLAVDGSRYTRRMFDYIGAHPNLLGPAHDYTVLTVVSPLPVRAAASFDKAGLAKHYAAEAEDALGPIRKYFATNALTPTFAIERGNAGDAIARFADNGKFELVVMGSHGHGSIANLVVGSVATKVLAKCKVPVLIVR